MQTDFGFHIKRIFCSLTSIKNNLLMQRRNDVLGVSFNPRERAALDDESFISRELSSTVDFYSGIICHAMSLPVAISPVMFATGPGTENRASTRNLVGRPRREVPT
jgi:hypothetical protein